MTLILTNSAIEFPSLPRALSAKNLYKEIVKENVSADILKEIAEFSERNLIISLKNHEIFYDCCPKCLKAHILNRAKELGIEAKCLKIINKIIKQEAGHRGYYLDSNILKSIAT